MNRIERTQLVNTIYTSRVHGEYTRFPEPNERSIWFVKFSALTVTRVIE